MINPETTINTSEKTTKNLRLIVTVGLVLVLIGILCAYIYYGMYLAKQSDAPENVNNPEQVIDANQAIIDALENAPVADASTTERMINALENETVSSEQNENTARILEALGDTEEVTQ